MSNGNEEQREKLLKIVRDAVQHDKALRERYHMGDKFRFIRDRLEALLTRVEENLVTLKKESEQKSVTLLEDETLIYVYLYNAHGIDFKTWEKMLNPAVFYEYSVNRPIYTEKSQIDAFIRSRTNKPQHGYLTVAVKRLHVLKIEDIPRDMIGNPLVKVKEGSLHVNRLISFTHNGQDYILDEDNKIVKKVNPT